MSRSWAGGGLLTFGVAVCKGHSWYPAFASGSSAVAVGLFGLRVSCYLQFAPGVHSTLLFSCSVVSDSL